MNRVMSLKSNTSQVVWFGLGGVTSLSFTIVIAAVLSRQLGMAEYGTYRQVLFVYQTLLVVFTVGLPRAYSYFLAQAEPGSEREVVRRLTMPLLGLGAIFSLVLFVGAPAFAVALRNPELEHGLRLFSPIPLFLLPTLGLEGIYAAVRQTHVVAFYQVATKAAMILAVVLPVLLVRPSYDVAIYGWNAASIFAFLLAFRLKYAPFPISSVRVDARAPGYRTLLAYSVPLMTASLYGIAFRAGDKFFVSRYFGEAAFAEFSNGFMDLPFVGMVAGATAAVLMPVFTRQIGAEGGRERMVETWLSAWRKSAIIVYPLLVFCFFNAERLMVLLYGEQYAGSAVFFRLALLANFFAVIAFVPVVLALGETRFYARVHLVVAFAVWVLGYMLVVGGGGPVHLAGLIVVLDIGKALAFVGFISRRLAIPAHQLVPKLHLARLVVHSTAAAYGAVLIANQVTWSNFAVMAIALVLFGAVLLLTSPLVRLDYFGVLRPLLRDRVRLA
jgi:O-antigen/teichoic acid export membrane protein